jgi:hypothetical protein
MIFMDEPGKNYQKLTMTYGAYTAFAFILISLGLYFTNSFFSPYAPYLNFFAITAFIYLAAIRFRDTLCDGFVNYAKVLGFGTYIAFWSSIIYGFYVYVLFKYIDPALLEAYLSRLEAAFMQANMPDNQVESLMTMYKIFLTPFMMGFVEILNKTLLGFVISLVIAFIVKRESQTAQL